jgi:beta-N-acetylhexosaminidase
VVPLDVLDAIREGRLLGMILFRDNLGGCWREARAIRRDILGAVPPGAPFLLMMDEEGGLISQTSRLEVPNRRWPGAIIHGAFEPPEWPSLPTPRALGRLGSAPACQWVGQVLGERLRQLDVSVDLAPCLDLDTEAENPVIGSRSYGSDPEQVARLGAAFAHGLALARVTACYKHYPGHGATQVDSHLALPRLDHAELDRHLAPFQTCLEAAAAHSARATHPDPTARWWTPWIMSGHLDWGDGEPVSLSHRALSRIRRWNRRSLVITDALEMKAVDLSTGAAEQALLAGNDVLLVAREWEAGLEAMDRLEESAARREDLQHALSRSRRRILELGVGEEISDEEAESDEAEDDAGPATGHRRKHDHRSSLVEERERTRSSWAEPHDSFELAPDDGELVARQHVEYLFGLHRASVRLSRPVDSLPEGGWIWVIPTKLGVYAELTHWSHLRAADRSPGRGHPRGQTRFCDEIQWVIENAGPDRIADMARRLAKDPRPILVATLFRGRPWDTLQATWAPLFRLPGVSLVAHLLDEVWPGERDFREGALRRVGEAPAIALTSGPSAEALDGLHEALNLGPAEWKLGEDRWWGPVWDG